MHERISKSAVPCLKIATFLIKDNENTFAYVRCGFIHNTANIQKVLIKKVLINNSIAIQEGLPTALRGALILNYLQSRVGYPPAFSWGIAQWILGDVDNQQLTESGGQSPCIVLIIVYKNDKDLMESEATQGSLRGYAPSMDNRMQGIALAMPCHPGTEKGAAFATPFLVSG